MPPQGLPLPPSDILGYRISVPSHLRPDCDGAGQVWHAVVLPMYSGMNLTRSTKALAKVSMVRRESATP